MRARTSYVVCIISRVSSETEGGRTGKRGRTILARGRHGAVAASVEASSDFTAGTSVERRQPAVE